MSPFWGQPRQRNSFMTPIRLGKHTKEQRSEERRKREKRTGIPSLIISSTLDIWFPNEKKKNKNKKRQQGQNGAIFCLHLFTNPVRHIYIILVVNQVSFFFALAIIQTNSGASFGTTSMAIATYLTRV